MPRTTYFLPPAMPPNNFVGLIVFSSSLTKYSLRISLPSICAVATKSSARRERLKYLSNESVGVCSGISSISWKRRFQSDGDFATCSGCVVVVVVVVVVESGDDGLYVVVSGNDVVGVEFVATGGVVGACCDGSTICTSYELSSAATSKVGAVVVAAAVVAVVVVTVAVVVAVAAVVAVVDSVERGKAVGDAMSFPLLFGVDGA
jgi:hypothetical protein